MRARITLLLFAILYSFTCLAQTNFENTSRRKVSGLISHWVEIGISKPPLYNNSGKNLSGRGRSKTWSIRLVMEGIILMYMIKPVKSWSTHEDSIRYSKNGEVRSKRRPRHNLGQIASLSPIRKLLSSLRLRQETRPTCSSILYWNKRLIRPVFYWPGETQGKPDHKNPI